MSWIRPKEYEAIKQCLQYWDVKKTAVEKGRAIGTIYQVKNTKNHEEYCKQYNQRQYEAEYATKIPFKPSKLLNRWLDDSGIVGGFKLAKDSPTDGYVYTQTYDESRISSIEDRLDNLERQVKALEYLGRKK